MTDCTHEEECEITTLGDAEEIWLCIECGNIRTEPLGHVCFTIDCCYEEE